VERIFVFVLQMEEGILSAIAVAKELNGVEEFVEGLRILHRRYQGFQGSKDVLRLAFDASITPHSMSAMQVLNCVEKILIGGTQRLRFDQFVDCLAMMAIGVFREVDPARTAQLLVLQLDSKLHCLSGCGRLMESSSQKKEVVVAPPVPPKKIRASPKNSRTPPASPKNISASPENSRMPPASPQGQTVSGFLQRVDVDLKKREEKLKSLRKEQISFANSRQRTPFKRKYKLSTTKRKQKKEEERFSFKPTLVSKPSTKRQPHGSSDRFSRLYSEAMDLQRKKREMLEKEMERIKEEANRPKSGKATSRFFAVRLQKFLMDAFSKTLLDVQHPNGSTEQQTMELCMKLGIAEDRAKAFAMKIHDGKSLLNEECFSRAVSKIVSDDGSSTKWVTEFRQMLIATAEQVGLFESEKSKTKDAADEISFSPRICERSHVLDLKRRQRQNTVSMSREEDLFNRAKHLEMKKSMLASKARDVQREEIRKLCTFVPEKIAKPPPKKPEENPKPKTETSPSPGLNEREQDQKRKSRSKSRAQKLSKHDHEEETKEDEGSVLTAGSTMSSTSSNSALLFCADVQVRNHVHRIPVFENEDLSKVAARFAALHNLDINAERALHNFLKSHFLEL